MAWDRGKPIRQLLLLVCVTILGMAAVAVAMETTVPFPGIREHTPAVHALTGARIVVSPERVIAEGTLVIRDGIITAVGATVAVPDDARVWDMEGRTLYPGLIDAYSELPAAGDGDGGDHGGSEAGQDGPGTPSSRGGAAYWNNQVTPQLSAAATYTTVEKTNKDYRSQGVTVRLLAPAGGIIKGTSVLVNTANGDPAQAILAEDVALHLQLTPPRGFGGRGYPDSPMGAMTLVRQAFYDADWYAKANAAVRKHPHDPRPERNDALEALLGYRGGTRPVIINTANQLYYFRADQIGREFDLNLIVNGSGDEYRRLDEVAATGRPVIAPLNFPKAPNVKSPEQAMAVSLETLMDWDIAPENPGRLAAAGVRIALTGNGLKDEKRFLGAVRTAVKRGLSQEAALRALTLTPAELYGMGDALGTLAKGRIANLIVTDGDLFDDQTKILETWVDGNRYEVRSAAAVDVRGTWSVYLPPGEGPGGALVLSLKGKPEKLSGEFSLDSIVTGLKEVDLTDARVSFSFAGDTLGWDGVVQMSATLSGEDLVGDAVRPDGRRFPWNAHRTAAFVEEPDTSETKADTAKPASYPVNYPLGAFGVSGPPEQPAKVFFKNATVWTSDAQGTIENASLLVEKGRITAVGTGIEAPSDAVIVDLTGKHLAPGIIDCHSHIATDGGINESGQTITAEVRIADFIDPTAMIIYRQLAGGVTSSNILHGSANTIGGQTQVIKLRWGAPAAAMKFTGAKPGIKFALGENVKQSNWGDEFRTRYPQTRMGAEQIVRDEFAAARDYERRWALWKKSKKGIPPRRDLELDAIVEVLNDQRMIHCHAYRQDEILALMRTCEAFGVRLGVFQHILEGYKVADVMAQHGVGGSSFSDWWAYKFEVYDAIPYNGVLMHNAGVVVSFNSDSGELARRLNTEAAKAVKYGGLSEEEALKFVTYNPAKQLEIADRVGSLTVGKDADLSIWSASPLSTFAVCEQTWIDGRRYFDRTEDAARRETVRKMRAVLIQKILDSGAAEGSGDSDGDGGRGRLWPSYDIFCGHGDGRFEEGR